jgi:hypothetical protein
MIGELSYVVKVIFGLDRAERNLIVFPDDTFVVSYPKSGNTWTRFLIANLAYPTQQVDFTNINRLIADPALASKRFLKSLPRPRILKSHESFDARFKNVIFIVRDPRDVALSEYHFEVKRKHVEEGYPIDQYVKRFVAGESGPYGSWGENVASWVASRQNHPRFLLVRYEDLESNAPQELIRIALYLGINPTPELLSQTVERSSADRMRKLEQAQADQWSATKNTRKDMSFVRAAKSGGWKEGMPQSSVSLIESAWGPLMKMLGYKLSDQALDENSLPKWATVGTRTG